MSQRYDRKKPKSQDIQLVILKLYTFYRKMQQGLSGPGESCRGYVSVYENTPEKLPQSFPLKFGTTLRNGSKKGAVGA